MQDNKSNNAATVWNFHANTHRRFYVTTIRYGIDHLHTLKTKSVLYSASYGGCKRDTVRICCWPPCCCDAGHPPHAARRCRPISPFRGAPSSKPAARKQTDRYALTYRWRLGVRRVSLEAGWVSTRSRFVKRLILSKGWKIRRVVGGKSRWRKTRWRAYRDGDRLVCEVCRRFQRHAAPQDTCLAEVAARAAGSGADHEPWFAVIVGSAHEVPSFVLALYRLDLWAVHTLAARCCAALVKTLPVSLLARQRAAQRIMWTETHYLVQKGPLSCSLTFLQSRTPPKLTLRCVL